MSVKGSAILVSRYNTSPIYCLPGGKAEPYLILASDNETPCKEQLKKWCEQNNQNVDNFTAEVYPFYE